MEYIHLQDQVQSGDGGGGVRVVADTVESAIAWSLEHATELGLVVLGLLVAVVVLRMLTRGSTLRP